MNNNFEKPKLPKNETPEQEGLREKRERLEETKKFKTLCVDYHHRNSSEWNMSGYTKDKDLYIRFLNVDIKKLPDALKPVYLHRLAYVQAMVQLGGNKRIRAFALKFMGLSQSDLAGKFELLYKKVKDAPEFKALRISDFSDAVTALEESLVLINKIPSGVVWGQEAAKLLAPDTVDDPTAHVRLRKAFQSIADNTKKLGAKKRKNQVLS